MLVRLSQSFQRIPLAPSRTLRWIGGSTGLRLRVEAGAEVASEAGSFVTRVRSASGAEVLSNGSTFLRYVVEAGDDSGLDIWLEGELSAEGEREPSVVLTASAVLPAAGANQPIPSVTALVPVPVWAKTATFLIRYTRGAEGGSAAHTLLVSDGTRVAQLLQSGRGGFGGVVPPTSDPVDYAFTAEVNAGETHIGMISAESGAEDTPGTMASWVAFHG